MKSILYALFASMAVLAMPVTAFADTLIGRVSDATSEEYLAGASISIDLFPIDGVVDFQTTSGPTGYYGFVNLPVGQGFNLTISRGGYASQTLEEGALATEERRVHSVALEPNAAGVELLDVWASVRSTLGDKLEGIPVRISRYTTSDASDTPQVRTIRTDTKGQAVAYGFEPGWFRFEFNQLADLPDLAFVAEPEPPNMASLMRLDQSHVAMASLAFQPHSITVLVQGFDPVKNAADRPLRGVNVAATGVDPANPNRVLFPTRALTTDASGMVTFDNRPAVQWKIVATKLNYAKQELVIDPAAGGLPKKLFTMDLEYEKRAVIVNLRSAPYDPAVDWLFEGIPVELWGIPGTNTEGISRTSRDPDALNGDPRHNVRIFRDLPFGTYQVLIEGQSEIESFYPLPYFAGDRKFVTIDNHIFEGAFSTIVTLNCNAVAATVRGSVWVADTTTRDRGDGVIDPIYRKVAMDDVIFGEVEGNVMVNLLPEGKRAHSVDAQGGSFSLALPPSVYGISIPGATDYWGDHVSWSDLDLENDSGQVQGWPYPRTWPWPVLLPFGGGPPRGHARWPSTPLVLHSNHEYHIDIYLHKRNGVLMVNYQADGQDPSQSMAASDHPVIGHVPYPDLNTPDTAGTVIKGFATPAGGGEPIQAGSVSATHMVFYDVPPGNYQITAEHPRNSFSSMTYAFPDWPAPGVLPTFNPGLEASVNRHIPLHPNDISKAGLAGVGNPLQATYEFSSTSVSITTRSWSEASGEYGPPQVGGLERSSFVQLPYAKDAVFRTYAGMKMPQGPFKIWISLGENGYWSKDIEDGKANNIDILFGGTSATKSNDSAPGQRVTVIPKAVWHTDPSKVAEGALYSFDGESFPADGSEVVLHDVQTNVPLRISPPPGGIGPLNFQERVRYVPGNPVSLIYLDVEYAGSMDLLVKPELINFPRATVHVHSLNGHGMSPLGQRDFTFRYNDELGAFTHADSRLVEHIRLPATPVLVETILPGYLPVRQVVTPPVGLGHHDVTVDIDALESLPAPKIDEATVDRAGMFLPTPWLRTDAGRVVLSPDEAEAAVTATWKVVASAAESISYLVPALKGDPDADEDGMVEFTVQDQIAKVFLVGKRFFEGNPFEVDPEVTGPEDLDSSADVNQWLCEAQEGKYPGIYCQIVDVLDDLGDSIEASDQFSLAYLPPGVFEPYIVLVTAGGSTAVQEFFDYAGDRSQYQLRGVEMPAWLGATTDAMSYLANGTADIGKELVDFGLEVGSYSYGFKPVESGLDVRADRDEVLSDFVDYTFAVAGEFAYLAAAIDDFVLEPSAASLSDVLIPGIKTALTFGTSGSKGTFSLGMKSTDSLQSVEGEIEIDPEDLDEMRLSINISNDELGPWRPEILSEQSAAAQTHLQVDGTLAFDLNASPNLFNPAINRDESDLSGSLNLDAEDRRTDSGLVQESSFARIDPPVDADGNVEVDGKNIIKVGGSYFEKITRLVPGTLGFEETTLAFQMPLPLFNTANVPTTTIAPITSTKRSISDDAFASGVVSDLGPVAVRDAFPLLGEPVLKDGLWYSVAKRDGGLGIDVMEFDPSGQRIVGRINATDSAASIPAMAIGTLPNEHTVAIWSEIAKDQIEQDYPESCLLYSLRNNGEDRWSEPIVLDVFVDIVDRIKIAETASRLGVFIGESDRTGLTNLYTLTGDAAGLGTPDRLLRQESIEDLEVAVINEEIVAMMVNRERKMAEIRWEGIQRRMTRHRDLFGEVSDIGLLSHDQELRLSTAAKERIQYWLRDEDDDEWRPIGSGIPFPTGAHIEHLQQAIIGSDSDPVFTSWMSGGAIYYAFINPVTGELVRGPFNMTENFRGFYETFAVIPRPEERLATIVAEFRINPTEIRRFDISLDSGTDGLNDSDNDGLSDIDELRIVDASLTDNITSVANVLPNADFDGDGITNAAEINEGSDPTDRFDIPGGVVIPPPVEAGFTILTFERLADGRMRLFVASEIGQSYSLTASDDLIGFDILETKTADTNTLEFIDTAPPARKRYYRVIQ